VALTFSSNAPWARRRTFPALVRLEVADVHIAILGQPLATIDDLGYLQTSISIRSGNDDRLC
jgi:hypothetical protein